MKRPTNQKDPVFEDGRLYERTLIAFNRHLATARKMVGSTGIDTASKYLIPCRKDYARLKELSKQYPHTKPRLISLKGKLDKVILEHKQRKPTESPKQSSYHRS